MGRPSGFPVRQILGVAGAGILDPSAGWEVWSGELCEGTGVTVT